MNSEKPSFRKTDNTGKSNPRRDTLSPTNPPREPALLERDLERTCSDLLQFDRWRPLKTDPVSRREWGKAFGEKGMADRLYIRYEFEGPRPDTLYDRAWAQVMWIEWKRIRAGRRQAEKSKPHQLIWQEAERARGALVFRAGIDFPASIDGFLEWYRRSGLMRRPL